MVILAIIKLKFFRVSFLQVSELAVCFPLIKHKIFTTLQSRDIVICYFVMSPLKTVHFQMIFFLNTGSNFTKLTRMKSKWKIAKGNNFKYFGNCYHVERAYRECKCLKHQIP